MTHRSEHNEIDIVVFELNPNYDHQYGNEIFSKKKFAKFFLWLNIILVPLKNIGFNFIESKLIYKI